MAGLVPAIMFFFSAKTWMPGTTAKGRRQLASAATASPSMLR